MNLSIVQNKNSQARELNIKNVMRNLEPQKGSSNIQINPLSNAKRNINKPEEGQANLHRLYAAILNNNNNTNITTNDDITELNGLIYEIQRLKQLVDIPHMMMVIRNLNNKLLNCRDEIEKLQTFIEAF